ncbi:lysine transporter LysE [Methanoculleus taiwanensis]|uniref:Lysine transporter LysE n=1 Tax=Methanoculleus taiwanensis TaxID=1550565 RepID=A0A498H123_9EURY|nr:LysE family transporter [Methanoculleus taiwanensis]RXE56057.1 lysine transporter LysE [Methanoculleus taiwanensis]
MYTIPDALILGFLIGLTGALAPGPTLIATINASLRTGWSAGPRVTAGHVAVEVMMVFFVVAGVGAVIGSYTGIIAGVGGAALVAFGLLTVRESRHTTGIATAGTEAVTHPVVAGVVTSLSNPYFWIWWLTVGSALLLAAYEGGIVVAGAFVIGHWAADLGWLTLVSASIHRGRFILGEQAYRWILGACGAGLIGFGLYYLVAVFA